MDKDKLLARRADTASGLPEDTVDIEGVGSVRVRALTRGEVYKVQQLKGRGDAERRILAWGLLDPELTENEVRQWQDNSPAGEMEPVADKIRELSGLNQDADKESYKSAGDEPDA